MKKQENCRKKAGSRARGRSQNAPLAVQKPMPGQAGPVDGRAVALN